MTYIPKQIRQQVIDRANGLCEYCHTSKKMIVSLEIDHIMPVSLGGDNNPNNLSACCQGCNKHKKDVTRAIDPETNTEQHLFNPRTQVWDDHFQWDELGIFIIGKTSIGHATIDRLKMNRDALVESRRIWVTVGLHPPK
ncbi:MAG: HNH endonuclease [Anaerolineae bacterium]|jgi:hypothetical protein|nr:HNH endonuclease [Anaerolineae bacterium]